LLESNSRVRYRVKHKFPSQAAQRLAVDNHQQHQQEQQPDNMLLSSRQQQLNGGSTPVVKQLGTSVSNNENGPFATEFVITRFACNLKN
jgi:hypothetical protein